MSIVLSETLCIETSRLTLDLHHPEITLGGGEILLTDPARPPEVGDDAGDITVQYHWKSGERSFRGTGRLAPCGRGFTWQLRVWPEDGGEWSLRETTEGSADLSGWTEAGRLQIFHGDNVRGVTQGCFLMEGSYFVPILSWQRPLNAGRWQTFPGLWLHDATDGVGFICGVLSQEVWKHTLHGMVGSPDEVNLEGRMLPPGIPEKRFAAGRAYVGETVYYEITTERTPGKAMAGYVEALSVRLRPSKVTSSLAHHAFWDSWNDRKPHFWDVSMELIERTRDVLTRDFPTVRSMEIDDGYAFGGFQEVQADIWTQLEHGVLPTKTVAKVQRARRLGAGFAYEPDRAVARNRFPDGVGAGADAIRAAGLLPAIWLGLSIVGDARIVKERPEWFVSCTPGPGDDAELGQVFAGDAANRLQILDPSVPEVRAYLREVFEILFREWGYSALKFDFWTYAFENDSFRLAVTDHTALELRSWLFATIREYLPEETYLVTCCDISTGNPFFSRWVDTVRYGIDIGNGKWESIWYSALTGTFLLHVEAWRFYLLNADSIGALRTLAGPERRCFLSWCAVTRSLCEVAGDLAQAEVEEIRLLQKLLLAPKNGREVRIGEYLHLSRNEPAAVLFAPGDLFATVDSKHLPEGVLGVFNWSDERRTVMVDLTRVGGEGDGEWLDADFFQERAPQRRGARWNVTLPPRSAQLSQLTRMHGEVAVLDSGWAVTGAKRTSRGFQLSLRGNSPAGCLIYWPGGRQPTLAWASISVTIAVEAEDIYRIAPTLATGVSTTNCLVVLK